MKKLLLISNCLLLVIILFIACNSNNQKDIGKKDENPVTTDEQDKSPSQKNDYPSPTEKLTGLLDDNLAELMSDLYKRDKNKAYVTGTNNMKEDARSIWFSLEKLKLFIAKIESSVSGASCDHELGIRIYYAKYPNNFSAFPSLVGLNPGLAGMHTVFLTPTFNNGKRDVDFDFENVGDNPCKPIPYKDLLNANNPTKRSALFGFSGRRNPPEPKPDTNGLVSRPRVENHGGLMPPPAGEGSFPTGGQ
ncbi:MAG: hypothetical protein IPO42_11170 [Chitinophagaceae bacterium]|nr:hypothetical protein [Chitinophagaceae bacterium]